MVTRGVTEGFFPIDSPRIHKGFQWLFTGKFPRVPKDVHNRLLPCSSPMKLFPGILIFLLLTTLTACTSTQRRIEKNQEVFDRFPADVQTRIRRGDIAIGDTPAMVRIAKGRPDTVTERETRDTLVEVWRWYSPPQVTPPHPLGLTRQTGAAPYFMEYPTVSERERLRVEFTDGKASLIEEVRKD